MRKAIVSILSFFILSFALLWVLYSMETPQMRGCGMTNPIVRKRIEVKEPFVGSASPADAPALLLADTLSPIENPSVKDSLTSQRCFEADFQTRLEHAGSYRQMTNNYRREGPDSCSAPLHDLLLHFYRVVPLP